MPALPGFSLYSQGVGSVEMLSGRGVSWPEVRELEGQDDGNERELANKVRKALEVRRDG